MFRAMVTCVMISLLSWPATAQEAGWHYSPYQGEGDRAAMGCSRDSTPAAHSCVVVRCEDDDSVGLYIETSREGGDAGQWVLTVGDASTVLSAEPAVSSPYGARVVETNTSITTLVRMLQLGTVGYLEPLGAPPVINASIPMNGSLSAINQALYFCAPKAPAEEPATD